MLGDARLIGTRSTAARPDGIALRRTREFGDRGRTRRRARRGEDDQCRGLIRKLPARQPFPEGLLKVGDVVRIEIDRIGELENTVIEEPEGYLAPESEAQVAWLS